MNITLKTRKRGSTFPGWRGKLELSPGVPYPSEIISIETKWRYGSPEEGLASEEWTVENDKWVIDDAAAGDVHVPAHLITLSPATYYGDIRIGLADGTFAIAPGEGIYLVRNITEAAARP